MGNLEEKGFVEVEPNYWVKELGNDCFEFVDNRNGIAQGVINRKQMREAAKRMGEILREEIRKNSKLKDLINAKET